MESRKTTADGRTTVQEWSSANKMDTECELPAESKKKLIVTCKNNIKPDLTCVHSKISGAFQNQSNQSIW